MLNKQVAIITGASRGIGKEIAFQMAEKGARLSIIGSSEEVHKTKSELEEQGYEEVLAYTADVSNENEVDQVVEATKKAYGKVDILINNAGIGDFKPIEEVTVEEWRRTYDINVQGVFLGTKAVLPIMKSQGFGTIITVASDVSRYTIPEGGALYTSTKYAVQGFMGSLAQEVRKDGIRAGTINPGMVDTYFANGKQGDPEKAEWLKVHDIAEAVVYMALAPNHMVIDEMHLHPLIQNYPRI
ncbi:NADP-dependent 3-hydroxy acid dehydrogenase YdfG [Halobacillus karajensis]|uniref:Oxidoreductase n=1 Tax=Halobacillus karajensis TaxID=195088 RepID=A0A024P7C5_9BACI|nr:SDR family oxidoreductase [Halobacillus karajensis]CDQ21171.1 putative oxidoreductase [Halobacillus karajensis]CDQ24765.1 putative oxidoreductase [Halobacillus karajensis]CDQ28875.1 putative oxidoreductase [Halobacillus karajensis]SEH95311.1 NADP-dependent 3-hydroxy acid dehydrogenase YdfG [Halobacillus karajensis]